MATATVTQTVTYTYQDYLAEWESCPEKPARLTEAEFEATLNSYMGYTQRIGIAYKNGPSREGDKLREERRPLRKALLL